MKQRRSEEAAALAVEALAKGTVTFNGFLDIISDDFWRFSKGNRHTRELYTAALKREFGKVAFRQRQRFDPIEFAIGTLTRQS